MLYWCIRPLRIVYDARPLRPQAFWKLTFAEKVPYQSGINFNTFIAMKTLFIIRHAKSDQSFLGNDFDRPLNDRGKKDAPVMAKRLLDKKISIDSFISSPAKRAKKTAELFAKEYEIDSDNINFIPALYHAQPDVFREVIKGISDEIDSAAIFSHNPGITYFVNELVQSARIDNMPTCSIFAVRSNIKNWSEFETAQKEFVFFDYPKNV